MNYWLYIGIALILWVIYDLFTGKVWLHREINREYESALYWSTWLLWATVAIIVTLGSL